MKVDAGTKQKLVEIGAMIREVRTRAQVSQADLAGRIGMQRENFLRIEKGRLNVTVETLMRIAAGLDVELSVTYAAAAASPAEPTKAKPRRQRTAKKKPSKKRLTKTSR